jgi:AraC family transcriptional activator of pobA
MKQVKFNKTICGVDFLLNVLKINKDSDVKLEQEFQSADFFQIVFISKGNGNLLLNDQKIELADHAVIFISENQNYKWNIDLAEFDATFLVFQEDFLNEFFADKFFTYRLLYFYQSELPTLLNSIGIDAYLFQLADIKKELENPESDSVHLIRSVLYNVLIKLNRIYSKTYEITSAISIDNMAYAFRRLVEKNINTLQRVDDYALLMNTSRISLNAAVKKQFNTTASDFIKTRLVYEIKMKLLFSNKTIEELALDFNFSEANHFSRFFKTRTQYTPTEYRLSYQNGSSS